MFHFLNAHRNSIFIFTQHIINYSGTNPHFKEKEKTPHLLGRPTSCSWWRITIRSGPLFGINCPPLTFQSPLHPYPPLWPILYYNDDINNFGLLFWNNSSRSISHRSIPDRGTYITYVSTGGVEVARLSPLFAHYLMPSWMIPEGSAVLCSSLNTLLMYFYEKDDVYKC
jgi:hypothetical protein